VGFPLARLKVNAVAERHTKPDHLPRGVAQSGRSSLVAQAYRNLKKRIINSELPPGYQLLEKELADQLGMSRTPLREALIRLENEGLVEILPRRGVRISLISPHDMREIYQILTSLETTAVELIASQNLGPDSPELAGLEARIDAMSEALNRDDLVAWAKADVEFHQMILDCCGNKRLAAIANAVSDQANRVRMTTLRLRPKPTDSVTDHRALIKAIRRHDPTAAREIHMAHRLRFMKMLLELTDLYNLRHM
jgi:DNA-binding GntR family transcriptional regulator